MIKVSVFLKCFKVMIFDDYFKFTLKTSSTLGPKTSHLQVLHNLLRSPRFLPKKTASSRTVKVICCKGVNLPIAH